MRISDWSSDVCSSDLNLPGVERSPLARFKARYGNRLHSVAWYVDNLEGAFKACRERGVRMTDVTGRSVEDLDHVGQIKYFRSEEHTSELQSLMRISYAVFCLKKKINKNDNKHKK